VVNTNDPAVISTIIAAGISALNIFLTFIFNKHYNKNMQLFEKKKEALTSILTIITETIISIKANYSWEFNKFNLVAEEKCDTIELEKKIHSLPDRH
jgi:heme/copper-type cytochrome/quinol oxidase subunit 2